MRIARLVRVELLKLGAHPFFLTTTLLVLAVTALVALASGGGAGSLWKRPHAIEIFATAARWGLFLSGYALVIYGAMLFAGEFDRGTIKLILTRPVTRTDVFAAKCLVGAGFAAFLVGAVFATAWGVACARGELGPVWVAEHYAAQNSAEEIEGHLRRAVATAVPALFGAVFLGIAVSNLVESSGYAVAIGLIVFIAVGVATSVVGALAPYWMNTYPGYAFETLQNKAAGLSIAWKAPLHERALPQVVPAVTAVVCAAAGYVIFLRRNITA